MSLMVKQFLDSKQPRIGRNKICDKWLDKCDEARVICDETIYHKDTEDTKILNFLCAFVSLWFSLAASP